MKILLTALILLLPFPAFSLQWDTSLVNFRGNHFYHIHSVENTGLLIFLHGGVTNPSFSTTRVIPNLDYLLEGNSSLIALAQAEGLDVLVPVKNDSLNWLDNYEYCFQTLKAYTDSAGLYRRVFQSGFSDGGTGSYRIFYTHPEFFDGLIVFNGYPQLNNFYRKVDYSLVQKKKVIFLSTRKDNVIPYEFLLTEYARQKKFNPDTYFFLSDGGHKFGDYRREDLEQVFEMIRTLPDNIKTEAIHGYLRRDSLIEFYEFREKISRKYGYEPEFLKENQKQKIRLRSSR